MPELPEVETIRRDLDAQMRGAAIVAVTVSRRWQSLRHTRFHENRNFRLRIVGATIARVDRRSKYLLFHLSDTPSHRKRSDATVSEATPPSHANCLIVHLGMSGQLLLVGPATPRGPHTHAIFTLDETRELRFEDPRMFGRLWVTESDNVEERIGNLGPEPLARSFTWRVLAQRLRNKSAPVKSALLDPRVVAGVGNIYSDEALFEARLHPRRACNSLNEDESQRLARAIKVVLRRGIALRGTTMNDERYRDPAGAPGGYWPQRKVYGREGEPCVRCSSAIARGVLGGRSYHFCPRCQR